MATQLSPELTVSESRRQDAAHDDSLPLGDADRLRSRYDEALDLWLSWNERYEHVSEEMYRAGSDPETLRDLMDQLDELRQRAIRLSQQLLRRQDAPR